MKQDEWEGYWEKKSDEENDEKEPQEFEENFEKKSFYKRSRRAVRGRRMSRKGNRILRHRKRFLQEELQNFEEENFEEQKNFDDENFELEETFYQRIGRISKRILRSMRSFKEQKENFQEKRKEMDCAVGSAAYVIGKKWQTSFVERCYISATDRDIRRRRKYRCRNDYSFVLRTDTSLNVPPLTTPSPVLSLRIPSVYKLYETTASQGKHDLRYGSFSLTPPFVAFAER